MVSILVLAAMAGGSLTWQGAGCSCFTFRVRNNTQTLLDSLFQFISLCALKKIN
jgi:hypothetical protein